MNKNNWIIFCLALLWLPLVLAASKPIAGTIDSSGLLVNVYVQVNSDIHGMQTCLVSPALLSSPSFATNLANLVLEDFPEVSCGSMWQSGDKIWYTADKNGYVINSKMVIVESGTGLQYLPTIDSKEPNLPQTKTGSNGKNGKEVPPEETRYESLFELKLNYQINREVLTANVNLQSSQAALVKLIIKEFPNQNTRSVQQKTFMGDKEFIVNLDSFSQGVYQIQAYAYYNNKLVAVSNMDKFIVARDLLPKPAAAVIVETQKPAGIRGPAAASYAPIAYSIAFLLIILAIVLFLLRKK